MKRRICSILAVLALLFTLLPAGVFADTGFGNFSEVNAYNGQFTDVPSNAWYAESVASAYRLGLVAGTSTTTFNPDGNLRLSEVITLACSLHSRYYGQTIPDGSGGAWYQKYVDYALANGIISGAFSDYGRSATRAECIAILAKSLPAAGFAEINNIEYGAIPDVPQGAAYAEPVYKFYRAGIMQGYAGGEFRPSNNIRRCEISATLLRLADPSMRGRFTLTPQTDLSAEQIAAKCADAVFYIEIYDQNGYILGSGSGFFIDPSGIAVTNYHVIKGAHSAKIMLTDDSIYDVEGVYDYDVDRDTALLKIAGNNFKALDMGSSGAIAAGQTVFAIGSPQGLDNTISQGIISNVNRVIDGQTYIQTTAQISPGSSGGALLNTKGAVIGITSAYINLEGSQNLNLVIPINSIDALSRGTLTSLAAVAEKEIQNASSGELALDAEYSRITLPEFSGIDIYVYAGGSFDTLVYEVADESILQCEWGEWEDDYSIPLTISSLDRGNTSVTLSLLDSAGKVLLSKRVDVSVVDHIYNGRVVVTNTELSIAPGDMATVTIQENEEKLVTMHWENPDDAIASCEWGSWDGSTIPLYITGISPGLAMITVDMTTEGEYVGSEIIWVAVGSGTSPAGDMFILPEYDSISLALNSGTDLSVYVDAPDAANVYYEVSDPSMFQCEWGEWEDDYNLPLTIYTLRKGTAVITFSLLDDYDNVLKSSDVTVTVTDRKYNDAFSLTSSSVNLSVGESAGVTLSQNLSEYAVIHWESSNPDPVTCEWGAWSNSGLPLTLPLTIYGDEAGSTTITLDLMADGQYAGSKTITVNVSN